MSTRILPFKLSMLMKFRAGTTWAVTGQMLDGTSLSRSVNILKAYSTMTVLSRTAYIGPIGFGLVSNMASMQASAIMTSRTVLNVVSSPGITFVSVMV